MEVVIFNWFISLTIILILGNERELKECHFLWIYLKNIITLCSS